MIKLQKYHTIFSDFCQLTNEKASYEQLAHKFPQTQHLVYN